MSGVFYSRGIHKLPVEIIDLVAACLEDDVASLGCFSLTSKLYLNISRRRIFRHVRVRPRKPSDALSANKSHEASEKSEFPASLDPNFLLDFIQFLQKNIWLAKYIRKIRIHGSLIAKITAKEEEISLAQLNFIMEACSSLEHLALERMRVRLVPLTLALWIWFHKWSIQTLCLSQLYSQAGERAVGFTNYCCVLLAFSKIGELILSPATSETQPREVYRMDVPELVLPVGLAVRVLCLRGRFQARSLYKAMDRAGILRGVQVLNVANPEDDVAGTVLTASIREVLIPACPALKELQLDIRSQLKNRSATSYESPEMAAKAILPIGLARLPAMSVCMRFTTCHRVSHPCLCIFPHCLTDFPKTPKAIYIELFVQGGYDQECLSHLQDIDWIAITNKLNSFARLERVHLNLVSAAICPPDYDYEQLPEPKAGSSDSPAVQSAPNASLAVLDKHCAPPTAVHRAKIKDAVIRGLKPLRKAISVTYVYTTQPYRARRPETLHGNRITWDQEPGNGDKDTPSS